MSSYSRSASSLGFRFCRRPTATSSLNLMASIGCTVIANPDLPDMGFVGFNSSFCTVLCAEMAANWLVRYCDGRLANQPTAAEMYKNMDMMLHFRRVQRPAASVYGGLCVAPYHFKHFDELLADMGAIMRRRSPLVEKFTPPDADAYARFLASAPDYKVEPA